MYSIKAILRKLFTKFSNRNISEDYACKLKDETIYFFEASEDYSFDFNISIASEENPTIFYVIADSNQMFISSDLIEMPFLTNIAIVKKYLTNPKLKKAIIIYLCTKANQKEIKKLSYLNLKEMK